MSLSKIFVLVMSLFLCGTSLAASKVDGPIVKRYGKHFPVKQDVSLDQSATYRVVFDVEEQTGEKMVNLNFGLLARFLNMHAASGVPPENIQLALVVHGAATLDLLNDEAYKEKFGRKNPNGRLLTALNDNNVQIFVCGQSANGHRLDNDDLYAGVNMALSAMTVHSQLMSKGYTLNPF